MDEGRLSTRTYGLVLLAIVALALLLRLPEFGSIPPGLYRDEAYNGLDALRVLEGARPLWFPANNGREPFFIYLVACSVALFGPTALAVRAPALLLGLLTVPATAFLGTSLFSRRVGLLAAAVTAVAFWPVHLSRVGFRAVGLPLFVALALGFLWRGLRHGRARDFVLAGLLYGASFYTYLAVRFTPFPLLVLGCLGLWPAARLPRPTGRQVVLFVAAALLTTAPLLVHLASQPGALGGRMAQVSVFNPAISQGDPWGALGRQTLSALGAFLVRGDRIPRHNLPWRPIFDPALGLAFVVGAIVAAKRRGAGWFVLLWVGAMLLPTILAEDTPHFLRGIGIQPLVFTLPALGLAEAWRWLGKRGREALGVALAAVAVLSGAASTADGYFRRYAQAETVYYHFEGGSAELAARINAFLRAAPPGSARQALVSERLWRDWPSLRFLLADGAAVQLVAPAASPPPGSAPEALLAVWPFEAFGPALARLPQGTTLEVDRDLRERGDLEPEARPLALIIRATAAGPRSSLAELEHGVRLLEAQVQPLDAQRLRVRLIWEAGQQLPADYTAFVHVLRGDTMLGQHDGPPAGGVLPTSQWRSRDRIVDVHEVALSAPYDPSADRVAVGLYHPATVTRLRIIESRAPSDGDAVLVAVP